MSERTLPLVLACTATVLLSAAMPRAALAQPADVIAFVSSGAVHLRWKPQRGAGLVGYRVSRAVAGTDAWVALTPEPLARVRGDAELRAVLGPDRARFLRAFGVEPDAALTDDAYGAVIADPRKQFLLNLLSATSARVAAALGELYVDSTAASGARYAYRVDAVTPVGDRPVGRTRIVSVDAPDAVPIVRGLRAAAEDGAVRLAWERDPARLADGSVVAFNVYRSAGGAPLAGANPTPIVPVDLAAGGGTPRGTQEYVDRFLTNGVRCTYVVRALNAFGIEGPASVAVEATPGVDPVPAPPISVAGQLAGATARIAWEAPPRGTVAGYDVYRAERRDGPYRAAFTTVPLRDTSIRSYVDADLPEGATRWYAVRAVGAGGRNGPFSDTISVTFADTRPPAAPAGLGVTQERGRILLAWNANAEPDVAGYEVERSASDARRSRFLLTSRPTARPSWIDTVPDASETRYGYVVYAVDRAGNRSAPSPMVFARPLDIAPPSVPAIVSLRLAGDTAVLRWTSGGEPDLAHYTVYLADDREKAPRPVGTTAERAFRHLLVRPGTWRISVSATDSAGNESARSAAMPVTLRAGSPPPPPRGTAVYGRGVVTLRWDASPGTDVRGYLVSRSDSVSARAVDIANVRPPAREWIDRTVRPGNAYTYRIRAYDRAWRMSEALALRVRSARK